MDGFKKRLRESIQLRLSFWLSMAIITVAIVAGIFSFAAAFDEAHELQDDTLRQIAALFDQQSPLLTHPLGKISDSRVDTESRVVVEYLPNASSPAAIEDSSTSVTFPPTLHDGFQTVAPTHEMYRVLVKTLPSGERIAVAQETGVRDEAARDSALRTVMPFLILIPMLLFLVSDLVRKMLRPVLQMSAEIDGRSEHDLRPLPHESLPKEMRPFAVAINRLLSRVEQSMLAQRRFVADAAHELRTPMTALSLQAERLASTQLPEEARERVVTLRRGIERGKNLLDQLLSLAREQSATQSAATGRVSIQQVCRRVLEDLVPLAEAKQIDLGVASSADMEIEGSEMDLVTLVKNLADNAVRYTQPGGRVDITIKTSPQARCLVIEDTGPGIPEAERERVFDPFYRILDQNEIGSGLGLSIVQTIATRLGARLELSHTNPTLQSGLRVCVTWPNSHNNQE
jgi:two-component system OmpR family sensor kinase